MSRLPKVRPALSHAGLYARTASLVGESAKGWQAQKRFSGPITAHTVVPAAVV